MSKPPDGDAGRPQADTSQMKFDDLHLSSAGKQAMREGFGYEYLKPVQAKTFDPILQGTDLVVRAKTGAGKTLSFLLPAMERIASNPIDRSGGAIDVLIVSPVRELSMQIFQEAEKLAHYYSDVKAVCMVGGADWKEDMVALDSVGSAAVILIVTPGRLQTHLSKTAGFAERFAQVRIAVLDEVDQLVSDIFLEATQEILRALASPSSHRQSLFYSATMSDVVTNLMSQVGKADYTYVDMLQDADVSVPEQIDQTYSVVPTEQMTVALWKAIQAAKEREEAAPKIVAIFMTGRIAAYYAESYRKSGAGLDVFEIHAQIKKQEKRTEASEQFRAAPSGILFTSDVSSRGLDYPGVTDVIQHGAPHTKAEYIHRLGRTGRAGNRGRGLLLLHEFEQSFLAELRDLPLTEAALDGDDSAVPDFTSMDIAKNVKAQAYYSRINHVMRNFEDLSKVDILREAKRFATSIGALDLEGRPPEITQENATKMGVADITDPALYIVASPTAEPKAAAKVRTRAPKGLYAPGKAKAEGKDGDSAEAPQPKDPE